MQKSDLSTAILGIDMSEDVAWSHQSDPEPSQGQRCIVESMGGIIRIGDWDRDAYAFRSVGSETEWYEFVIRWAPVQWPSPRSS